MRCRAAMKFWPDLLAGNWFITFFARPSARPVTARIIGATKTAVLAAASSLAALATMRIGQFGNFSDVGNAGLHVRQAVHLKLT